jgi:hypothetical protein
LRLVPGEHEFGEEVRVPQKNILHGKKVTEKILEFGLEKASTSVKGKKPH